MITRHSYFYAYSNHPEITPEITAAASRMLAAVNGLLQTAQAEGVPLPVNPATSSQVSGQENGGWRPRACPIGAPNSHHKTGHAVDVYDPDGELDAWLDTFETEGGGNTMLASHGLAREHPDATPTWTHLQDVLPRSGRRTFYP